MNNLPKSLSNLPELSTRELQILRIKTAKKLKYRANYERLHDWHPSPQQEPAYLSDADEVWCFGGNRSGKSELVCATLGQFAQGTHPVRSVRRPPPVKVRHVGTDWRHGVEAILLEKYKHLIPRTWLVGDSWSDAWSEKGARIRYKNGSAIIFRAWEQDKDKHGGEDLDAVGLDEHGPKDKYDENAARLVDRDGFLMAAMTPEEGVTWEEDHVTDPPRGVEIDYFFFETENNPHLSGAAVQKLKAKIRDPKLIETKLKGRFVPLTGLVIPSYNADISVIPDRPLHGEASRAFCIDLHTKTPSAALWGAWEPSQGRDGYDIVVYRTAKKAHTVPEWKQYIAAKSTNERIDLWLGDESERETGTPGIWGQDSIIAEFGKPDEKSKIVLPIQQVEKGPGSFDAGIYRLRDWFAPDKTGKPRIFIFKSCDYGVEYINGKPCGSLPWELRRYSFKKEQKADEETLRENVRKVNDHFIDCLRYLAMVGPMFVSKHNGPIIVRSTRGVERV